MTSILVLSDLHAFSRLANERDPPPSYLDLRRGRPDPDRHPIDALRRLLEKSGAAPPEILLCGGDIGHQADPVAIRQVWSELHQLQQSANIPHLFATAGNHDLDSRYRENKFDPRGFLQQLQPSFPFPTLPERSYYLEYWATNFSIVETDHIRLLIINSSAYHGNGPQEEPELRHGRISEYTLAAISERLIERTAEHRAGRKALPTIDICMFHHHLKPQSSEQFTDESSMRGADDLISILSRAEFGNWLLIHGHKHRPKLYWGGDNTSGPLVLSAASFAATRVADHDNQSPNQFHIIEFADPVQHGLGGLLVGEIHSWSWGTTLGWHKNMTTDGLPPRAGFGCRIQIPTLAAKLSGHISNLPVKWAVLTESFRELLYIIPSDLDALLNHLAVHHNINTEVSRTGDPIELARVSPGRNSGAH